MGKKKKTVFVGGEAAVPESGFEAAGLRIGNLVIRPPRTQGNTHTMIFPNRASGIQPSLPAEGSSSSGSSEISDESDTSSDSSGDWSTDEEV